jgi:hypothetical protein
MGDREIKPFGPTSVSPCVSASARACARRTCATHTHARVGNASLTRRGRSPISGFGFVPVLHCNKNKIASGIIMALCSAGGDGTSPLHFLYSGGEDVDRYFMCFSYCCVHSVSIRRTHNSRYVLDHFVMHAEDTRGSKSMCAHRLRLGISLPEEKG